MARELDKVRTETHHGVTIPVGKSTSLENVASKSLEDVCLESYEGTNLDLHGKNNLQAAVASLVKAAADGDPDARTELLDRVLGKPLQRQVVDSRNVTLIGFLDQVRAAEGPIPKAEEVDDGPIILE
jgi:hypothetical protein